jgi:conjugative relaxase-like TrwC/TraI family protein
MLFFLVVLVGALPLFLGLLSVRVKGVGSEAYYLDVQAEYYSPDAPGETPGVWWENGASKAANLKGKVVRQDLESVSDGFLPDGTKTRQNAGKEKARAFTDLCLSDPKGLSIVEALASDSVRKIIAECRKEATELVLELVEERARARLGKAGQGGHIGGQILVSIHHHFTNRNEEVCAHQHLLVQSGMHCDDGKWRAMDLKKTLFEKSVIQGFGAAYRAEFSYLLEKRLGYEITRTKGRNGKTSSLYDLKEMATRFKGLCDFLSSRSKEVVAHLKEKGGDYSAKEAEVAALATRSRKGHIAEAELRKNTKEVALAHGLDDAAVKSMFRPWRLRLEPFKFETLLLEVKDCLTRTQSHFSKEDILKELFVAAQGRGVSGRKVREGLTKWLSHPKGPFVEVGEGRYSTPEIVAEEKKLLSSLDGLASSNRHGLRRGAMEKVLRDAPHLNKEQREALTHLTRDNGVACVTGYAGTGKSTLIKAANTIWTNSGFDVIGCAAWGKAADGLAETGIRSYTLAKLVGSEELGFTGDLERRAQGEPRAKKERVKFTSRSVVVLDEAGAVGTKEMAKLVEAVRKAGAKLVMIGDSLQLQSLSYGAPYAAACKRLGCVNLLTVVRQVNLWQRRAVKLLAHGRSARALHEYARRGFVHVAKSKEAAMKELVEAYARSGLTRVKEKLILAATNEEVHELNKMVQKARRQHLGKASIRVGNSLIHENDQVLFRQNRKLSGQFRPFRGRESVAVKNGSFGTVLKIDRLRKQIHVRLFSGKIVHVKLKDYKALELGYAASVHRAQGSTVEASYVLTGGHMTHRQSAYVEASRARQKTHFFLSEEDAGEKLSKLIKAMEQDRSKSLAHRVEEVMVRNTSVGRPTVPRGPELHL